MAYCDEIDKMKEGEAKELHRHYHDNHYGFRLEDDDELFGRLLLEINQAGLSWTLMLKKLENFRKAYDNFSVSQIADYGEDDFERLRNDAGIIRNRLKIRAAIENARRIMAIQSGSGSFRRWLDEMAVSHMTLEEWTKLFRKTFVFMGSEIVNEFLMSIGMLPGAHTTECPVAGKIKKVALKR